MLADGWPDRKPHGDDRDWVADEGDTVEDWVMRYEAATEQPRQIVAAVELDALCARQDILDGNVRWVMLHLIEETARQAGHADIIRETIDGVRDR